MVLKRRLAAADWGHCRRLDGSALLHNQVQRPFLISEDTLRRQSGLWICRHWPGALCHRPALGLLAMDARDEAVPGQMVLILR